MARSPLSNAFDMLRTTKVSTIFGFLQPLALAGGFAGLAAGGRSTVALASNVTGIGSKEDLTVLTLALSDMTCHGPESPQAHDRLVSVWKEENGEGKGV